MRLITTIWLLASAASAGAETVAWENHTDGRGTPFESRWAVVEPDWEDSSPGTMFAAAGINGQGGELNLYINHPRPVLEALASEFTGEKDNCTHDNWRLAVDRREFGVKDTYLSTDNSATFIEPADVQGFWQAFIDGSRLAVQVERDCDGDMTTITLVYSLRGSLAAAEHVLEGGK